MKTFLIALVCFEGTALAAAAGVYLLHPDWFERAPLAAPEFRPRIQSTEGGEEARYRLEDLASGKPLGFVDYRVRLVEDKRQQALGRVVHLRITERTPAGAVRADREILFRPEFHGFLPPTSEDDVLPTGDLPVVSTISSCDVPLRRGTRPGFLVEAVRPRWRATGEGVHDRFWFVDSVPVFGLVRRERGGVAWVLQ